VSGEAILSAEIVENLRTVNDPPEPRWVSPQRSSSPLPTLAGGEWALPSSRTLPRSQSSAMIFGSSVPPRHNPGLAPTLSADAR